MIIKGLFITILLLMLAWEGVIFGADTCPDVMGIWEVTYNAVVNNPPGLPYFGNGTDVMAVHAQNGCSFYGSFHDEFIVLVGTLRKLSSTQYAVNMQYGLKEAPLVIEGTFICTTGSPGLVLPPGCSSMSTFFHIYVQDLIDPLKYISEAGNMNFSKQ